MRMTSWELLLIWVLNGPGDFYLGEILTVIVLVPSSPVLRASGLTRLSCRE